MGFLLVVLYSSSAETFLVLRLVLRSVLMFLLGLVDVTGKQGATGQRSRSALGLKTCCFCCRVRWPSVLDAVVKRAQSRNGGGGVTRGYRATEGTHFVSHWSSRPLTVLYLASTSSHHLRLGMNSYSTVSSCAYGKAQVRQDSA